MIADTNKIIRDYLITQTTLTNLVGGASPRIYCPRLPEDATLPAISFFTRGGITNPHIEKIVSPSIQFKCWADNAIDAREVYRALFSALQGIQDINVGNLVIGTDGKTYRCIQAHTSAATNKPITGADYVTYWMVTGGIVTGSTWVTATAYIPTYKILSAREEVQGQDLQDIDIPNYFNVLTFFEVMIRADT